MKLAWTSNATLRYDSSLLVKRFGAHSRNNFRGTCFQIQINGTTFVTLEKWARRSSSSTDSKKGKQVSVHAYIATSDGRRLLL